MKRYIKSSRGRAKRYAVKYRDMHTAHIHLLVFGRKTDAEDVYDFLTMLEDSDNFEDMTEDEYADYYMFAAEDAFSKADEIIEEIDTNNIDRNNIYTDSDGNGPIQIINKVYVDMYV